MTTENPTKNRILIVDDDEVNLEILREILEGDYDLDTAMDGEACLQRVKEFEPDLVLLDIMMPELDGYEACKRIKASPEGRLTQVMLVSARASSAERLKGYDAGADDYVVKPFDPDEILAKIRIQFRLRGSLRDLAKAHSEIMSHNSELEELVRERTAEVIATRDITAFALAKLAESRDPETGEHLDRIRTYAKILAEQLSDNSPYADTVDELFVQNIYQSSPLHDIGKVGIPDVILLKPGRLSEAEFEVMKRHTVIGADALKEAARLTTSGGFLKMAADIARYHHERFDGTGYPEGLKSTDIPLSARIVALADVYDALTSVRVYKPAYDAGVAQTMIEQEDGKQFDPAIVEAFRRCFDSFREAEGQISRNSEILAGAAAI